MDGNRDSCSKSFVRLFQSCLLKTIFNYEIISNKTGQDVRHITDIIAGQTGFICKDQHGFVLDILNKMTMTSPHM